MSSNFTGGNPISGANYHTKNGITRDVNRFNNTAYPHGAIVFLICEGNMRGAIHDGKTCGGVAHFPLFSPSTDFSALYDLIDNATNLDGNASMAPDAPAPNNSVIEDLIARIEALEEETVNNDGAGANTPPPQDPVVDVGTVDPSGPANSPPLTE